MKPFRVCYFSATSSELPSLSRGVAMMQDAGQQVRVTCRTQTQLFDQARIAAFVSEVLCSDAVIITLHGGKASCPAFEPMLSKIHERRASGDRRPYLHIQPVGGDEEAFLAAREHSDGMADGKWHHLFAYFAQGGPVNIQRGLTFLRTILQESGEALAPPLPIAHEGLYHPDLGYVADVETYERERIDPQRPTVGLWFFQTLWVNGNLDHLDALIREIEMRGANVLPVFSMRLKDASLGNRGSDEIVESFFLKDGRPRIDVLINAMSMSMTIANREYRTVYPRLNVAVLQAMVTSLSRAAWEESRQGMSMMDVTYQAAQPEFDGSLITVPVATREENVIDPITGGLLIRYSPIADRISAIVSLALKWAALHRLPHNEKRIAVVFHHYPPRNDRIGCAAGLDSFASVKHLLDRMADEGYQIDRLYRDGDDLAHEMLGTLTCDRRWIIPEEMARRAVASATRDRFLPWHRALPETVRRKMSQDWGNVPGSLFVHKDVLYFPGVLNGNVFLTIQPPRGYLENPEAVYHDPSLSPPHHYLAHYRWIRDVFRAHAVIHVGKHGSLEWLPGKALALSGGCYPDLSIMDLPNIYPYIINDPSEGTQAKRRSYCCIIDHLTPPYTNADLYEELTDVDRALSEYVEAGRHDPGKLPILAGLLWEAVEAADLHQELGITREAALQDMDSFLKRLHAYLSEIGDSMISDGLHVLGRPLDGDRLVEFLAQLTRLPNGDVPSLREELVAATGRWRGKPVSRRRAPERGGDGEAAGEVMAEAHDQAKALLRDLAAADFSPAGLSEWVKTRTGTSSPGIERVLRYVCETLVPNLRKVPDEMDAILAALSGRFVPPGPSGAPTRGQADILPTGRNFYSLDARTIPTLAAWEVGKALGDALLERYLQEQGRYPDSVGIILWGGPTMRSKGDDIAEILYLLGLRPVWRANGIVEGLEVIPAAELGRPRIDVVPRISGFFRDAFPNLVELLDGAVRMVAALAESSQSNFVRKNVLGDVEEYRKEGASDAESWRLATLRVFGCPPGTYGAGVAELVESRQWNSKRDLGEIYVRYSSHAYGQGCYGAERPAAFRRLLSRMDVTVKNEDSREYDMLSCTDFYNYYGGLIAAVNAVRGEMPLALVGDASNPERVLLRTTQEEAKFLLRARLLNPKWLTGLQRHGYKGAGDLSKVMDILLGWDATADVMEDWMYERVAARYALDPEMQAWLRRVNPYALQNILDKLLETIQRGMWDASPSLEKRLRDAYLEIEGDIEEAVERVST